MYAHMIRQAAAFLHSNGGRYVLLLQILFFMCHPIKLIFLLKMNFLDDVVVGSSHNREHLRRCALQTDIRQSRAAAAFFCLLHFNFPGFDKSIVPKAPELSRIWRCRFKNLAEDPQTPEMEGPRVTYDSSEAVPAF